MIDKLLASKLLEHLGHSIEIVYYGDIDDPHDVCIECTDCCEVIISSESDGATE